VRCPHCQSDHVVKRGKTKTGQQRYLCKNDSCPPRSFRLAYRYKGRLPEIKQQIIEMSLNGSGIRDTARVLNVSPTTVINELKKKESSLKHRHERLLTSLRGEDVTVQLLRVEEAKLDEMWRFVGKKAHPRWLWHAVDHPSGQVLAYVFGTHQDTVFIEAEETS
jgi:insertion element IS1 protein InsB